MRVGIVVLTVLAWALGATARAGEPAYGPASAALSADGERIAIVMHSDVPELLIGPTDAPLSALRRIALTELDLDRRFRVSSYSNGPSVVENARWFGNVTWLNDDEILLDVWSEARVIRVRRVGEFRRSVILSTDGDLIAEWPAAWQLESLISGDPDRVLIREAMLIDRPNYNFEANEFGVDDGTGYFREPSVTARFGIPIYEHQQWLDLPDDVDPHDVATGVDSAANLDAMGVVEVSYAGSAARMFWFSGNGREILTPGIITLGDPAVWPDTYQSHWTVQKRGLGGLLRDGSGIVFAAIPHEDEVSIHIHDVRTGEASQVALEGLVDEGAQIGLRGRWEAFNGFLMDPNTGRAIGVEWRDPLPVRYYLDERFAEIQSRVAAHLEGDRIDLWSWDDALAHFVVRARGVEGSAWYLYSADTDALRSLAD